MRFWTFWKLISYIVDVPVEAGIDSQGNIIQLVIRNGQFLLTSPKMVYSYGNRYKVLQEAYRFFNVYSMKPASILLLGGGMGSGLQLINEHKIIPDVVFVEKEQLICQWFRQFVRRHLQFKDIEIICSDAYKTVKQLHRFFDLIVVDLFVDDMVPKFVGSEDFVKNVIRICSSNGLIIINITKFPESNWQIAENIKNILSWQLVEYTTFEVGEKNIVYGIRRK